MSGWWWGGLGDGQPIVQRPPPPSSSSSSPLLPEQLVTNDSCSDEFIELPADSGTKSTNPLHRVK